LLFLNSSLCESQNRSIAREWNEQVLHAIRNDYARPTIHARNLFHTSIAIYDIWAVFNNKVSTFLLGKTVGNYRCNFDGFYIGQSIVEDQKTAMSYAVYRIMLHRFSNSPGIEEIYLSINNLMDELGYDKNMQSVDYHSGNAAALGNYMANQIIAFGMQDGSNEENDYANLFYEPLNENLNTDYGGNPNLTEPNHWQALTIEEFIDQSGNYFPGGAPKFLSPEWGKVTPFSIKEEDLTIYNSTDYSFWVYHDPGSPSFIQEGDGINDPYKWGFALVSIWGSHLDPNDDVMIDVSPSSIGNISIFPETFDEYKDFYNLEDGGDPSFGWNVNPSTGLPYEEQLVPRGDYTRVLAEFWADGPDSETPPGHWFTILNYVSDHPNLIKKFKGEGEVLEDLEWDVKSYFILSGAMHDSAIAAWGIKGYYDYIRPMSSIRYMSDKGQSSDTTLLNYHPHGIPLVPGYIEIIGEGDPLEGEYLENIGKIKLFTWRGHDFIINADYDIAGVGWILAENWFPYQRPSFITPPFAGYVSGHSTFSRAAAEVLTLLTNDEYFPGGMGTFNVYKNDFLKFEVGPSVDFQLQWATYRDASDQTSLSRIWGGIHPPIDDIPGRIIGKKIGIDAFEFGENYFEKEEGFESVIYPNPAGDFINIQYKSDRQLNVEIYDLNGRKIISNPIQFNNLNRFRINVSNLIQGFYIIYLVDDSNNEVAIYKMLKD
ncbi:MAG: T9SS type A sorting domain-containing protein, partial [Flavobacteriaceae bacterium]|nr:T9SS type A sorting domain-containing protein [Flavobacteriaceae bacterium]